MSPIKHLNKLKENLSKKKEELSGLTLSDTSLYYRRILKRLPDISHLKNIVLFGGLATLLILLLFAQRFSALASYLPTVPVAGGTYSEGVLGKIEQLNPLFSSTSSAEEAGVSLMFSGLTKKDGNRTNIPDLAEKWDVSADGKTYTFTLRDGTTWQDGKKLTADDVVFTVTTIQNPDTRSPLMEVWRDVEVSAPDPKTVVFKLKTAYAPFLSNTDLLIVPKHILESIPGRSLRISEFSSKPVGSGPYKFESLKKVRGSDELLMTKSDNYYAQKPYIQTILLKTYTDSDKLIEGYNRKEVTGIEKASAAQAERLPNISDYNLAIPEYDVLYFNLRAGFSKDKVFREAIQLATNRSELSDKVYGGEAFSIYAPILPRYLGYDPKIKSEFNLEGAKAKLAEAGYAPDADGILKKDNQRLSVRLITLDTKEKNLEAQLISDNLKKIGVEAKIEAYALGALVQDKIRPRDFDLLLVSQNLGADSDLYPFWHSSGINDPGLNFSGFTDRRLDKALEAGRTTMDPAARAEKYKLAQSYVIAETPAVFLVWPQYLYAVSKKVNGPTSERLVEPSDRFWNIANWYVREKQSF